MWSNKRVERRKHALSEDVMDVVVVVVMSKEV
jgi:hypothetical protein